MKTYAIAVDNSRNFSVTSLPNVQQDDRVALILGKSIDEYRQWMSKMLGAQRDASGALMFEYAEQAQQGIAIITNELRIQMQNPDRYTVGNNMGNGESGWKNPEQSSQLSWYERNQKKFDSIFTIIAIGSVVYWQYSPVSIKIWMTLGFAIVAFVSGIIGNPGFLIRWGDRSNKTRGKAVLIGCIYACIFLGIGYTSYGSALFGRVNSREAAVQPTAQPTVPAVVPPNPTPSAQNPPPAAPVQKKPKLAIQDGWTWTTSETGSYTYIKGRVKNVGEVNITYFEITAEYIDKAGNVLDTKFANSTDTIRPGNQKEFEIMEENDPAYAKVRLRIEEIHQ